MPLRDTITQRDDQITPISDPDSLISEPFVDSLARIQRVKYLEKMAAKRDYKKIRDRKLVATYLKSKFPDAFSREMTVPEKEFPKLLKLAKRRYIRRIVAGAAGVPAGIIGTAFGATFKEAFPFGLPFFIAGVIAIISFAVLLISSASLFCRGE